MEDSKKKYKLSLKEKYHAGLGLLESFMALIAIKHYILPTENSEWFVIMFLFYFIVRSIDRGTYLIRENMKKRKQKKLTDKN